jgi:mannitol/fructose-specific phosphotransferase system IIA component (Ntr-type)
MPELVRPTTTASTLAEFTRYPLVIPEVQSSDTAGITAELSQALHREGCIADWLPFYQTALNRELAFNSALACGLAFPHARQSGVKELQFAVGRLPRPVTWAGRGSWPVRVVLLISVPATEAAVYLRLLASIGWLAQRQDLLSKILEAPDSGGILGVLLQVPMDLSRSHP